MIAVYLRTSKSIICPEHTEWRREGWRHIGQALACCLQKIGAADQGIAAGYDTRFFSAEFARQAANVLSSHGIPVTLSNSYVPSRKKHYRQDCSGVVVNNGAYIVEQLAGKLIISCQAEKHQPWGFPWLLTVLAQAAGIDASEPDNLITIRRKAT